MLTPGDDPGILLNAMGEYQDQQRLATGDYAQTTMVCADWAFHEGRTGLDRDRIRHLLPRLVADGFAQGLGTGMVWGYRVGDGYAWISERGQQLAAWRHPPPPYQAQLDALGPDAADRLHDLLAYAGASGVTERDLERLEVLCRDALARMDESQHLPAAPPATIHSHDSRVSHLLTGYVLAFLRSIAAK